MNCQILATQFTYTYKSIIANTHDLTHEESLQWPSPGGNCVNWLVGHILHSRKDIIKLLEQESCLSSNLDSYRRGVDAQKMQSDFLPLNTLYELLKGSQEVIIQGLAKLDEIPKEDAEQISSLAFHEAYHAGQIGLLRRLLGKKGQIK